MNKRSLLKTAVAGLALATAIGSPLSLHAQAPAEPVYELRTYTTNEGKLPELIKRFSDSTIKLFDKHGMTTIGAWVPVDKENGADNTLIYLLSHKSRAAADASLKAFSEDPEWKAVREATEAKGKFLAKPPESIFLTRTEFSPELKLVASQPERTFELRTYTTNEGKLPNLHARFTNHTMKLFEKHGMTNVCYWTPTDAAQGKDNKLIYILAHASKEAGLKSFDAFRADPVWVAAKGESEKGGSLTVAQPNGVKSVYMKPVDFSKLK